MENYFYIKNCSIASLSTGELARSLIDLRNKLLTINESCLYFHFWGRRLTPQAIHFVHHNDFASWVFHRLHDSILAEQLSIIDPTEFSNLEELRQKLLEVVEDRIDTYEINFLTKKEDVFHFISSIIIVFDSTYVIRTPNEMPAVLESLPASCIFYHFIDARMRTEEKIDDFSFWLKNVGEDYLPLTKEIEAIDPYFLTLSELKEELVKTTKNYFSAHE